MESDSSSMESDNRRTEYREQMKKRRNGMSLQKAPSQTPAVPERSYAGSKGKPNKAQLMQAIQDGDFSGYDLTGDFSQHGLDQYLPPPPNGQSYTAKDFIHPEAMKHLAVNALNMNGPMYGRQLMFNGIILDRTNLSGSDLSGMNAHSDGAQSQYAHMSFNGADLSGANLSGSNLGGAKFNGANLDGANLNKAVLEGTTFENATLTNTTFDKAKVSQTNLKGADLSGVDLSKVDYEKSALKQAEKSTRGGSPLLMDGSTQIEGTNVGPFGKMMLTQGVQGMTQQQMTPPKKKNFLGMGK